MYLILGIQLPLAVFDDGAAGDDADEGVLVIHHGDKILDLGPFHQVVHGGIDGNGKIVPAAADIHDADLFRLFQVQIAQILQKILFSSHIRYILL